MEINKQLLAKGRFLGLYYGQCIVVNPHGSGHWVVGMSFDYSETKLELKKLEDLTDEDVIKIPKRDIFGRLDGMWTKAEEFLKENGIFCFFTSEEADYLRSMSYAIPWMEFTVEDQVKNGWITLKEK